MNLKAQSLTSQTLRLSSLLKVMRCIPLALLLVPNAQGPTQQITTGMLSLRCIFQLLMSQIHGSGGTNYFKVFSISENMWGAAASMHMEGNEAKWLQVYKLGL